MVQSMNGIHKHRQFFEASSLTFLEYNTTIVLGSSKCACDRGFTRRNEVDESPAKVSCPLNSIRSISENAILLSLAFKRSIPRRFKKSSELQTYTVPLAPTILFEG